MPYATNPVDGVRTYFEDDGGSGPPVVVYSGYPDPLEWSRLMGLVQALRDDARLIFADHRGFGRSDKPRDVSAYALPIRVADHVAVLDALGIERAHVLGFSWGARLGFAIGEHATERVLSLMLCGNQPYAWNPDWPIIAGVIAALESGREDGMEAMVETWESKIGDRFPEPIRSWLLESDFRAIDAAFQSALVEGPVSSDLTKWPVPCLIYVAEADDMYANAKRAAGEIPNATFVSLSGYTHFSANAAVEELLPHVHALFHSLTDQTAPASSDAG
jgi:pimeloyl-ACP methyl ester carboxylesterase